MTEARWSSLMELAKTTYVFRATDGREIYLAPPAAEQVGVVYMYVNGEADKMFRLDDDIPYDVIMIFRNMWNRYVKSKQYTQ